MQKVSNFSVFVCESGKKIMKKDRSVIEKFNRMNYYFLPVRTQIRY